MAGMRLSTAGVAALATLVLGAGAADALAWDTIVYGTGCGVAGYTTTYYYAPPPVVCAPPPVVTYSYAPRPVCRTRTYVRHYAPSYYRTRVYVGPRYRAAPKRSIQVYGHGFGHRGGFGFGFRYAH